MRNFKINYAHLLSNTIVCLLFSAVLQVPFLAAMPVSIAVGVLLGFAKKPIAAYAGIHKEVWEAHIEEEIFPNNSMLAASVDMSQNVTDGRIVYIPQSGGSGNVVKNRSSYPAAIRQRTDDIVVYALGSFTSDPVVIRNAEGVQLSYDKRTSVIGEDTEKLKNEVFEDMLCCWVSSPAIGTKAATVIPSDRILRTTGAATAATAPDATGQRKKFTLTDLQTARARLVRQNRWFNDKMHAALPAQAIMDLFPADSIVTQTAMQMVTEEERRAGIIFKAQGFKIWERSSVLTVDGDDEILAAGASGGAEDCEAGLIWYEGAVERAMGTVTMNEQIGSPTEYGDVYSFEVWAGGRARRADYAGIFLLAQTPVI